METNSNEIEKADKPLAVKLKKSVRAEFNKLTHDRKTTMQKVISSFIIYYIKNPEKFTIENTTSMRISGEVKI